MPEHTCHRSSSVEGLSRIPEACLQATSCALCGANSNERHDEDCQFKGLVQNPDWLCPFDDPCPPRDGYTMSAPLSSGSMNS